MRYTISLILIFCIITYALPLFAGPAPEVLEWSLYTWDDGTPDRPYDTRAGGLQFPGGDSVTLANPWIRSPQYIRIIYNSDELRWGIRIVTDNERNIGRVYPSPLNRGPDGQWEWEIRRLEGYQYVSGVWQTGDDSVSFGGLIDPATKNNPNCRVNLAWQVFVDPVPAPDEIYRDWSGVWNVGGEQSDDWAYVVDKSNRWDGVLSVGEVYLSSPPYPEWSSKYEMVVTGDPFIHYLAQHPVVSGSREYPDPKPGDCDIAIYIAACFGVTNESGEFVGLMPAGNYSTMIYLELIHE